jgi:carbamoyltransferase
MGNKATLAIYGIKDRNRLEYPAYTHDHNICLMKDGKILQYLQLERWTGRKYDNRLDEFLEELIERNLLQLPDEFDLISVNAFVGSSFISRNGKIRFEAVNRKLLNADLEPAFAYYQYRDWDGKEIPAFNCSQELAHIASCLPFFGNFRDNSLLVHFDGASSVSNFSAFSYKDGAIRLIESGWDLKYLANFFNDNAFAFKIIGAKPGEHCSVPGKLMGYACMGTYSIRIENWLRANCFFKEYWSKPEEILQSIKMEFGVELQTFDNREIFLQDVAATFQHIFERELFQRIKHIQNLVKADYLYYSGGCALNIVANTRLINKSLFKDVFIPPCCNDSGLSIGAAAILEWKKGNSISIHSPYLNNIGSASLFCEITDDVIRETADVLMKRGIVAICNGDGEAGPRALGNRSLIALANNRDLALRLSMEVKQREWYRPVAPIMLSHNAEKVVGQPLHHLSKFMLLDFEIKQEYAEELEGVIHANRTARIQVINDENDNPFIFKLLQYLNQRHDIIALINTSFNGKGEPIVHTPDMAIRSARQMNLSAIVINNQFHRL